MLNSDVTWSYAIETTLGVCRRAPFVHRDVNTLSKIAEPEPNPLMQILSAKGANRI